MSDDQAPKEQKVGYKNPPKQSRFKPGQSGNPSGRPKRKLLPPEAFFAELDKPILVKEGGKKRWVTRSQAYMMKVFSDAMAGDTGARKQVSRWIEIRLTSPAANVPTETTADDEAILQAFLAQHRGGGDE